MAKGPARAVPRQRQVAERCRALTDDIAQHDGDIVGAEASALAGGCRKRVLARHECFAAIVVRRRFVATRRDRLEQHRDRRVGLGPDEEIDRRESLVIHVPAAMQQVIERHLNNLRRRFTAAGGLERTGQIDPVQAQDHVGLGDGLAGLRPQQDARRVCVERMIGREGGAHLEIGENGSVERFRERDTRIPGRGVARDAADEEHRTLGP